MNLSINVFNLTSKIRTSNLTVLINFVTSTYLFVVSAVRSFTLCDNSIYLCTYDFVSSQPTSLLTHHELNERLNSRGSIR